MTLGGQFRTFVAFRHRRLAQFLIFVLSKCALTLTRFLASVEMAFKANFGKESDFDVKKV